MNSADFLKGPRPTSDSGKTPQKRCTWRVWSKPFGSRKSADVQPVDVQAHRCIIEGGHLVFLDQTADGKDNIVRARAFGGWSDVVRLDP